MTLRFLLRWWPWRRRALSLPPPSLALLQARLKSAVESDRRARERCDELLLELQAVSAQLAREGFRADRLEERLAACRCGAGAITDIHDTKGRA